MRGNFVCVSSAARCQISDESKDEEIQEKEKKEKKTSKVEKATPSLASLNSNYREGSSSGSESNDRVRPHKLLSCFPKAHFFNLPQKAQKDDCRWNHLHSFPFQSTSPISVEDLEKFALRPAPRDVTIQCRVTRDRRGMEKGIYPTYYLHMEKEDGKRVGTCAKFQANYCRSSLSLCALTSVFHYAITKVFLMAGRKRKKCKTSNYLISTDATNLSRDTNCYIGKLRYNFLLLPPHERTLNHYLFPS